MTEEVAPAGVEQRIGRSAFWSAVQSFGSQIIRFSLFVVLARLIAPTEFGIVAIASVLVDFMGVMAVAGISDAVVRKERLSDEDKDTAFWTNLALGSAFLVIGVAISPLVARFFNEPQLAPVLAALCLTFVLWPFGATHSALMSRELRFKALAARTLGANLAGAGVGIVMALQGMGVWALVARSLLTVVALAALSWFAVPWRPKLRFSRSSFDALFNFGSRMMGGQIVAQVNMRGAELIAGLMMAPAAVGVLRVAGQCFTLLVQLSVAPIHQIALPLLSRTQGSPNEGRAVFARLSGLSALAVFPTFFGTMAVGDLAFPLIFGPDWRLTGLVIPLFCALAIPLQTGLMINAALASRGHAGVVFRYNLLQAAVGLPMAAIGGIWGVAGLLALVVARSYLLLPVGLTWLARHTEFSPKVLLAASLGPFLASIVMAGLVVGAGRFAPDRLPDGVRLVALVVLGAVIYLALILPTNRQAREIVRAGLGRLASRCA